MSWGALAAMMGLGLGAGVVGGMFGIGGGLIIVPALILIFGLDPKTATGTSLMAQLLPVAGLAVLEFWRRGEVDIPRGLGIAAGLVVGTLGGALLAGLLSPATMKRSYGVFLVVVGLYFLIGTRTTTTPVPPVIPAVEK
ncbi:TSUP family transporter [Tundrisphaera lichenicola]|uniref:TSUP family transporter n=1 Tax=Tundrisphaera lichenicola TaxID=2029860 RepID=UPI003EBAFEB8